MGGRRTNGAGEAMHTELTTYYMLLEEIDWLIIGIILQN